MKSKKTSGKLELIDTSIVIVLCMCLLVASVVFRSPRSFVFTGFAGGDDEIPPIIYDPVPENGSYVEGGDKSFFVKIDEEDLNTSTPRLYIKSMESSNWDDYMMTCVVMGDEWTCEVYGVTLSLDIVGSDTVEQYYFTAVDNSNNIGYLGTQTDPLIFTVDINSPEITFLSPVTNTYISGDTSIELEVNDMSSGVDTDTVEYSLDNNTWIPMTLFESMYVSSFDSTVYSDNQSVIIHARATDNIGNDGYYWINVSVDNTDPEIDVITPGDNTTLSGIAYFEMNVTDSHSGVNPDTASISIDGIERSMDCDDYNGVYVCNEYFDTSLLSDGQKTATLSITDNASNSKTVQVPIVVDNSIMSILVTDPESGSAVNSDVYINATVANSEGKVSGVEISITGGGYSENSSMTCSSEHVCYFMWQVSGLTEGEYDVFMNATNNADVLVNTSISITVDRTAPVLQVDSPSTSTVNGTISPKVVITDENGVDPNTVTFNISQYSESTNCVKHLQGKKYICTGNIDTSLMSDGSYNLIFYGSDLAGNYNSVTKNIVVNNKGTPISDSPSTTTTTSTGGDQQPDGNDNNPDGQDGLSDDIMEILSENMIPIAVVVLVIVCVISVIIFKFFLPKRGVKTSKKAQECDEK